MTIRMCMFRRIATTTTMTTDPHLTLHQLFSPAFPVGAFAWSHGLETAIHSGQVATASHLQDWITTVLRNGAGWSDALLLIRAASGEEVATLDALALALSPSAERRAETAEQGAAFAATLRAVWHVDVPDAAYPVAVGAGLRALGLPLEAGVPLFLQAFAANLCSAGVRLIPLGQTEGQTVTHALQPVCRAVAGDALLADPDDLGGFAPLLDIQSQRHEALYSRVYRS